MPLIDGFPAVSGVADQFEIRKNLAGTVARDSTGAVRTGVFYAGDVALLSATGTMNIAIAAFSGISSRSGGPIFNAHEGTSNLLLDAAPSSNSRIDLIYFKQNETASPSSDATNGPVFGFVKGTAAAIPVKPALTIPGAVEIGTVTIPSTATATNSSGVVIATTAQYTAAAGGVVACRNSVELTAWTPADSAPAYRLDTNRLYVRQAGQWVPADGFAARDGFSAVTSAVISNTVAFWAITLPALPYATVIDFDWIGQGYNAGSSGALPLGAIFSTNAGTLTQSVLQQYIAGQGTWVACPWAARLSLPANTAATVNLSSFSGVAAQFNGSVGVRRGLT